MATALARKLKVLNPPIKKISNRWIHGQRKIRGRQGGPENDRVRQFYGNPSPANFSDTAHSETDSATTTYSNKVMLEQGVSFLHPDAGTRPHPKKTSSPVSSVPTDHQRAPTWRQHYPRPWRGIRSWTRRFDRPATALQLEPSCLLMESAGGTGMMGLHQFSFCVSVPVGYTLYINHVPV